MLSTLDVVNDVAAASVRRKKSAGATLKRVTDIVLSLAAIAFLLPALIVIFIALYLHDGGPVLFRHKRIGAGGREFSCLKFRTMRRDADKVLAELLASDEAALREWNANHKLRDDPRIHRIGRFLRMTSLDELPQLFNVLHGEMSIVGPRPIVTDEIGRYGERIQYYFSMTPGMTGLWQVSGRNGTSYDTRVDLDVEYFFSRSARLDLTIMCRTVGVLLFERNGC